MHSTALTILIILLAVHTAVSLAMLIRSLKKSGLRSISYVAWLVSLIVCIVALVLALGIHAE